MTDSRIPAPADSDIVLCAPLRTPVGAYGVFSGIPVQDLASTVVKAVVERSGISPEDIDDVILGQASPAGGAPALGRVVALDAGLGDSVPGMQLDRRCGSGLQAVATAAAHTACGAADLVIAGGAESMSTIEYAVDGSIRWGVKGGDLVLHDRLAQGRETAGGRNHPIPGGMIETAENLREQYSLSREAQDALAARSQQRAVAAQEQGLFDAESVPVIVPGRRRKDPEITVTADEHPRPGTTASALAGLRPVRARQDEDATVTAGNASGQNDGAAALIVTTRARAAEQGLSLDDLDIIELNEAFAAQVLAVLSEWDLDPSDSRLNPSGSGISLGHPVGATGARLLVTLCHELARTGGDLGLATMCIGGGQGLAAVIDRAV